jgi:hypothetical protein
LLVLRFLPARETAAAKPEALEPILQDQAA